MIIRNLCVNHIENPLGYHMDRPVFSWNIESESTVKGYRIVIKDGETIVFDSTMAMLNPLATQADVKLKPRTRYTFTLEAQAENGETAKAEGYFETGKMDEPFYGKLITAGDNKEPRHPVFLRSFRCDKTVARARLYISACGLYEAKLNGRKIGDEHLTPYCTAYDLWTQIQTFDLDELIASDNTLEITLGNGWYRGRFGFNQSSDPAYGDTWKLIAEVIVDYTDGTHEIIATDESWNVKRSNIIFSNIYDGEIVDDTLPEMPVSKAVAAEAENTRFTDRLSLPVREQEHFKGCLIHTPKDETVLDFSQNMAGSFRFRVHEPEGTKIHIQFSEVMQDECFYRDNLRTAKAEYIYISDGNEHVLEPKFTFYGFRYAKIQGVEHLNPDDFTAYALYSDFPYDSSLSTGNEKINRLILNAIWGMKSNYLDVPTDCPQRDERMGWTGDAMVFSPTALYLGRPYAFLRKYLYDMAMEQNKNTGLVPFTIPSFHINQTATVWGDATVLIPWNMYQFTGDLSILKEHYPAMKSWIEWIRNFDGDTHNWRNAFHFGDWLALDGPQGPEAVKGATEDGFIADVYYRKSALITAETARLLGFEEDAGQLEELAETIRKGILEEYYTPGGRCAIMTQTGQILSVQNGLGNDEKAKGMLMKLLDDNDGKLCTGFVGTPLLCETLSMLNLNNYAWKLLFNEEYPGWLFEVNHGATTIWERWNSLDENGHISGTGMNSLNHYSYGSIVEWIYKYAAGIQALTPGFAKAKIAPLVHHQLGHLDCVYPSAAGTYEVHWKIEDVNHLRVKITIPYGCEAEVELPYFEGEDAHTDNPLTQSTVSAGTYEIVYETSRPLKDVIDLNTKTAIALAIPEIKEYLEALPLFAQTEFTLQSARLNKALNMIGITDPDEQHRIEKDLFALQLKG